MMVSRRLLLITLIPLLIIILAIIHPTTLLDKVNHETDLTVDCVLLFIMLLL